MRGCERHLDEDDKEDGEELGADVEEEEFEKSKSAVVAEVS